MHLWIYGLYDALRLSYKYSESNNPSTLHYCLGIDEDYSNVIPNDKDPKSKYNKRLYKQVKGLFG